MVAIDIDIKNNPNILERIIKALKSPRFAGWSIRSNAQWPNGYWESYPNQTPRFFRFDFELCRFGWQCDDDQAFMMESQDDVKQIVTIDQLNEILDFIVDNTPLFHDPKDPNVLSAAFDDFFNSSEDEKASSQPYSVKQPRSKKKEIWHPIKSWATNMENAYITVSKEQLEKMYHASPPFYHESTLAPSTATHDLNYTEYVKMMDNAKFTSSISTLTKILQTIEGLHGPYADPLRSFIKARLEHLHKEEMAVQANLQAHYYPYVGYDSKMVSKKILPKLKKLVFPKTAEATVPKKSDPPIGALLFDPPYSTPDSTASVGTKFKAMESAFEKLKKLAQETSVPIIMAHQPKPSSKEFTSPWAKDVNTFADFEMKQHMQEEMQKIYEEYVKMMTEKTDINPVAPKYPKFEAEYMAEWPTSHSVAAAYGKHYPMK